MPQENLDNYFKRDTVNTAYDLTAAFNKIQFLGGDTGITYRALNHWESEGLIPNRREEGKKWRRFSFVDYIWIKMIEQMRTLGLGIETIRKIYDVVLKRHPFIEMWKLVAGLGEFRDAPLSGYTEKEYKEIEEMYRSVIKENGDEDLEVTYLQLLITNAVNKRIPIHLIVFLDGEFIWVEDSHEFIVPHEYREKFAYESHISISITGILKKYLGSELGLERIEEVKILGENEIFLLKAISSGEYDSIKVNFKDKTLDTLEMVKSQEVTKKLVDVLSQAQYQDITIVQHKGRVTKIQNTVKHRFEKPEEPQQ